MRMNVRARCRTFPLDQLLEARRRRVMICLNCADDEERPGTPDRECISCGSPWLMLAEDIIIVNLGGQL